MKPIQIMMDPELLADLDATDEVAEVGRSAVIRRATAEYLARRRRDRIRGAYVRAYGAGAKEVDELTGWSEQGVWPKE